MEINEKQFIAGFNSGYLFAKYEPQILAPLLKDIKPINSYTSGMSWGQKEYELEKINSQLNEISDVRQKAQKIRHMDKP